MKILLLFLLLIPFAGCINQSQQQNPYYVPPGVFVGSWTQGSTTSPCTTKVTESDDKFKATITNNSSKEVLTLTSHSYIQYWIWSSKVMPSHFYAVTDSSNVLQEKDTNNSILFSNDANSFTHYPIVGIDTISISCNRQ